MGGMDMKDERLLEAYLATGSIPEAAALVGMDRTTAWRRGRKDEFKAELHRRLGELQARAEAALACRHDAAWAAMDRALESESETVRLRTAIWILERIMSPSRADSGPPSAADIEFDKTRMNLLKLIQLEVGES